MSVYNKFLTVFSRDVWEQAPKHLFLSQVMSSVWKRKQEIWWPSWFRIVKRSDPSVVSYAELLGFKHSYINYHAFFGDIRGAWFITFSRHDPSEQFRSIFMKTALGFGKKMSSEFVEALRYSTPEENRKDNTSRHLGNINSAFRLSFSPAGLQYWIMVLCFIWYLSAWSGKH